MAQPEQQSWPSILNVRTWEDLKEVVKGMLATRERDIQNFVNLQRIYVAGRKVSKIPASSADYDPDTDYIGDQNYANDAGTYYFYLLVDDGAGSAVWTRTLLDSAW